MDPTDTEEEEELVPAKRISGDDRRPGGEDEDRSIRALARSREKEIFWQRAECGQSTQIITVAECRSDLFGISLFIVQPARKLLRKREKLGEEDAAATTTRVQQMFAPLLTNFPAHRPKPTEASLLRLSRRQILGALVTLRWARCEGVVEEIGIVLLLVPTTREKLGAVRGVEMVAGGVEGSSGRVPWYSPPRSAVSRPGDHN